MYNFFGVKHETKLKMQKRLLLMGSHLVQKQRDLISFSCWPIFIRPQSSFPPSPMILCPPLHPHHQPEPELAFVPFHKDLNTPKFMFQRATIFALNLFICHFLNGILFEILFLYCSLAGSCESAQLDKFVWCHLMNYWTFKFPIGLKTKWKLNNENSRHILTRGRKNKVKVFYFY